MRRYAESGLTYRDKMEGIIDRVFGNRLKALRKNLGLDPARVAEILNISFGRLEAIESGKTTARPHEVIRLCKIYSIKPSTLWNVMDGFVVESRSKSSFWLAPTHGD